jgi:pantetheine-phosphate adenylyltransferase
MKIGIYSGCFDPFTNGHLWVAREGLKLFDRLFMPIGRNPIKTSTFDDQDRIDMIHESLNDDRVEAMILKEPIVVFANRTEQKYRDLRSSVCLLRGMRSTEDFEYEENILNNLRRLSPTITQIYVVPPRELAELSSTQVKFQWGRIGCGEFLENFVPPSVLKKMEAKDKEMRDTPHWKQHFMQLVNQGEKYESTTAGFCPYTPLSHDKTREFFEKIHGNGFIQFAKTVTNSQVRRMLDDFAVNVIASKTFHLTNVPIDCLTPTGDRYLPYSRSLGPIIVDRKTEELADYDYKGRLGEFVIIEGKHRWLDAKDRGAESIWAWVGEEALTDIPKIS